MKEKARPLDLQRSSSELPEILTDLLSSNRSIRNRALRLLAMHLAHLISLELQDWLTSSSRPDNLEVGIIADSKQLPFHRWQIQCYDTSTVSIDNLATAVGYTFAFRPTIILAVTTGRFTREARYFADRTTEQTYLQILLLDGQDLEDLKNYKVLLHDILARENSRIVLLKQSQ